MGGEELEHPAVDEEAEAAGPRRDAGLERHPMQFVGHAETPLRRAHRQGSDLAERTGPDRDLRTELADGESVVLAEDGATHAHDAPVLLGHDVQRASLAPRLGLLDPLSWRLLAEAGGAEHRVDEPFGVVPQVVVGSDGADPEGRIQALGLEAGTDRCGAGALGRRRRSPDQFGRWWSAPTCLAPGDTSSPAARTPVPDDGLSQSDAGIRDKWKSAT